MTMLEVDETAASTIARPRYVVMAGNAPLRSPASSFLPFESPLDETGLLSRMGDRFVDLQSGATRPAEPQENALILRPDLSPQEARQTTLQRFQGRVSGVSDTDFSAILYDLTDPLRPQEEASFGFDVVDPDDLPLLRVGAVFYWFIYNEIRRGTRRLVTELRFRRLARWTRGEHTEVLRRAAERAKKLGVTGVTAGGK